MFSKKGPPPEGEDLGLHGEMGAGEERGRMRGRHSFPSAPDDPHLSNMPVHLPSWRKSQEPSNMLVMGLKSSWTFQLLLPAISSQS